MIRIVGLGAGAGLVSALLFAVVATGSPPGMLLCYAAPLPIIIVALGWNHLVGLLAVAIGAIATSLALQSTAALAFALGPALPAWWMAYLVLLGGASSRPGDAVRPTHSAGWYPLGHLLVWIALLSAAISLASAAALGGGDYAGFKDTLRQVGEALLRTDPSARDSDAAAMLGTGQKGFIAGLIAVAPGVAAAIFTLVLVLNLWLGAKAVEMSGRLLRPWPAVPDVRMPPGALGALATGGVLAFGPGFAGVAGAALVGGFGMAFALQGLALLHHASLGRPGRRALLAVAYALTLFFGVTFLPLMALAGIADTATPLRRRLSRPRRKGPPPTPPVPPQP